MSDVATVRSQVALSLFTDFVNFSEFKSADSHLRSLNETFRQATAWSKALRTARTGS